MSREKPTAKERTISMFTGATDLDIENARDGTGAASNTYTRKLTPVDKAGGWINADGTSISEWIGPKGARVQWQKDGTYLLTLHRKKHGTFSTLAEAIAASQQEGASP